MARAPRGSGTGGPPPPPPPPPPRNPPLPRPAPRPGPPSPQVTGASGAALRSGAAPGVSGSSAGSRPASDAGQLALAAGVRTGVGVAAGRTGQFLAQALALDVHVGQHPVQPA